MLALPPPLVMPCLLVLPCLACLALPACHALLCLLVMQHTLPPLASPSPCSFFFFFSSTPPLTITLNYPLLPTVGIPADCHTRRVEGEAP